MAKIKRPRTMADVQTDPRVARVYRDTDGLWIDLADGWRNAFDEPIGALHGIHEDTLSAALMRMTSLKPCYCDECMDRMARKAGTTPEHARAVWTTLQSAANDI